MPRSNGYLRPIPPANTYFTHAETQWEALYEGYELTESAAAELLKQRHEPQWTGRQDVRQWLRLGVVNQMIPQAYRGAFLIALWATYETTVTIVGKQVHRFAPSSAPFNPPRNQDWLGWVKTYFAKDLRFDLFPPGIHRDVVALQKIRHVFAHSNGLRETASAPHWRFLKKYAQQPRGLKLDHGHLQVTPEFVRDSFKTMEIAIAHVVNTGREKLTANPEFIKHEMG